MAAGVDCGPPVALHVFSFSSEKHLPEQLASLRSFLVRVGAPAEFTIVSEGGHSRRSRELLRAVHPCVDVVDWDRFAHAGLPAALWEYAGLSWRGKQVAVVASLPGDRPVLYTDSDILFFPAATELRALGGEGQTAPRYLGDVDLGRQFLDGRMLRGADWWAESVNAGFFFHAESLDWTLAMKRLARVRGRPRTFTGQTVVHLAMHAAGARPFDREHYVMASDDRSMREDPYVGPSTVLRHYVTPVRHKLWLRLARSAELRAP